MSRTKRITGLAERRQISLRLDEETIDFLDREALVLSTQPPFHDISMSDVVRFAIREYREKHGAAKPAKARSQCDIVDNTAGRMCTTCGARSLEGETPVCKNRSAQ